MTNAALREAAVGYLMRELSERRSFHPDELYRSPTDDARLVDVLVAIGAIDAGEAAGWRARLERAGAPPDFDDSLRDGALEHLRALEAAGGDGLSGAIAAFRGVGLIAPGEDVPRRIRGPEEPYALVSGLQTRHGNPDPDDFLGSVPGPDARVAGLRVTVVELYENGVVIDWHYSAERGVDPAADALWARLTNDDDVDWDPEAPSGMALTDDAGTAYRASSGGWSMPGDESTRIALGHHGFTPGAPDGAGGLELRLAGSATLRVPLDR